MDAIKTYQALLNQFHDWLNDVKEHEVKDLAQGVDFVQEWATTGLDVGQEALETQIFYLQRDLAQFYLSSQNDLKESPYYLRIKDQIWHTLLEMTDKTQLEWRALTSDFQHNGIYQAGEEIALGELECENCGHQLIIEHVQTIRPCIECGSEQFLRQSSHV
ncbi:hypothetical protein HR060_16275 [Catenovulum sp. SM1970]|uniref:zinc ribbon-containing protein n=1 Tax=Marinifaba aquimaris TaxID=2741323 RepID=UPI001574CB17|nr:hypothetical protein [Marinifaba aquimaris]NTS78406.1 hypothetical protein [Marinifaba aquimaris]